MKVAYFTNFLFHHQYPLCREMIKAKDVDFTFVCCEPLTAERLAMGYNDMSHLPFVIRSYESPESYQAAMKVALDADVAIFGSSDLRFLYSRMSTNKLTFRYCERSLRKGTWRVLIPTTAKAIYEQYLRYRKKNLYILSASAYTSHDLSMLGFDVNKCFKWGYLPDVVRYNDVETLFKTKKPKKILWVGRFIECKHPEFALEAAKRLVNAGIDFELVFVGDGPLRKKSEEFVATTMPDAPIRFLGSMKPEEVRKQMDEASIFIMNSDRYEGWGAVVGEAMNSGCAVLVSHACGCAPFLIKHNENGRVYRYGDLEEFVSSLKEYLADSSLVEELGQNAYKTMTELWNVETGVPRLVKIFKALLSGETMPHFPEGPCSAAPFIKNNWYKR